MNSLSVRELTLRDINFIADYWTTSDPAFLMSMGVDLEKLPVRRELVAMLEEQLRLPYNEKQSYATIWLIDNIPVGHCNINKIVFGSEAYMHLHLWNASHRKKGMG